MRWCTKLTHGILAAFFVQHVVSSYDTHFNALRNMGTTSTEIVPGDDSFGKECSNLVVLLSELYNFQVVSCVLVYDIIRSLLDGNLSEFKVELLLKVARSTSASPVSHLHAYSSSFRLGAATSSG